MASSARIASSERRTKYCQIVPAELAYLRMTSVSDVKSAPHRPVRRWQSYWFEAVLVDDIANRGSGRLSAR
jgi:hypothetical protein